MNPLARYRAAFVYRDFRLLVAAFAIDATGTWAAHVVIEVYVFTQTHSLGWLAAMAAATWLPALLVAPLAGVIADRFQRRRVMVACAGSSAVVATGMAVVVAVHGAVLLLLLFAVVGSLVGSPYRPAAGALTPDIVDERALPTANGLFAALENLVIIVGPAIGGLIAMLGVSVIGLSINALSFAAAALLAFRLSTRSTGEARSAVGIADQVVDGVRALRSTPTAAVLLLFVAIDTLLAGAYTVVYMPISRHTGMGTDGYGYLLAAAAVGGILGAVLADRLTASRRLAAVIVGGVAVQALPYALTSLTESAALVILLQGISGVGIVLVEVIGLTAIQREVLGGSLSRVLSLLEAVMLLARVLGSVLASVLFGAAPYAAALLLLGLGCTALAVLCAPLLVRADRRAAERTALLADRVVVLERIELFAGLSRLQLERLAATVTPEVVPAGRILIQEGDAADALWVLVDGTLGVRSTRGEVQAPAIPDVLAPDVVGEIGVLRGIPRTATVTAAQQSVVWRIEAADYLAATEASRLSSFMLGTPGLRLMRTHPSLARDADAG